jgi:hypothetical protein
MEMSYQSFTFVISLAAVVNGLGIVRLLSSLAEYLRHRHKLEITHYWVFSLFIAVQLLVHILLWWSLWGMRGATSFNFLMYLFLLSGPTLIYLATSVLVPDVTDSRIDLREVYFSVRRSYFTLMSLTWLWAILIRPVLEGRLAPSTSIFGLFLLSALVLRLTGNPKAHAALALAHLALLVAFVGFFGMQLGGQMVP